jgi:hypothetical protein
MKQAFFLFFAGWLLFDSAVLAVITVVAIWP